MIKLVTDNPQNNTENMLNLAFEKNGEVWIRHGSADGEKDCTLADFVKRMCVGYGQTFGGCLYDMSVPGSFDDLNVFSNILTGCSIQGCPVGTTYFAMIQAAELRERLRMYEEHGVISDGSRERPASFAG